jgi:hypothetical protein
MQRMKNEKRNKRLIAFERPYESTLSVTIETMNAQRFLDADFRNYDAVIVQGGDGTVRRCVELMYRKGTFLPLILHPVGSFNVVAKMLRSSHASVLIERFINDAYQIKTLPYHTLNQTHVFLFSAGNMGDLHHIFIAETLRFGFLKHGLVKYLLALLFLLPMHFVLTPFMLISKHRFFIFTPIPFLPRKFGSFYRDIEKLEIDLGNPYGFLELDGDIVIIPHQYITLEKAGHVRFII